MISCRRASKSECIYLFFELPSFVIVAYSFTAFFCWPENLFRFFVRATHDLYSLSLNLFTFYMIAARDIIMNTNNIRTVLWSESKKKNNSKSERRWNEEDSRALNIKNQHTKQKIEIEWPDVAGCSAKKKKTATYITTFLKWSILVCSSFFSEKGNQRR